MAATISLFFHEKKWTIVLPGSDHLSLVARDGTKELQRRGTTSSEVRRDSWETGVIPY